MEDCVGIELDGLMRYLCQSEEVFLVIDRKERIWGENMVSREKRENEDAWKDMKNKYVRRDYTIILCSHNKICWEK